MDRNRSGFIAAATSAPLLIVLLALSLSGCGRSPSSEAAPSTTFAPAGSEGQQSPDAFRVPGLLQSRANFVTNIKPNENYVADGPAAQPPAGVFDLVKYDSPAGKLVAYVTPDPKDGKKHPAMLWAHGGFGGIGDVFWSELPPSNDQSAKAFRDAALVLMTPSWRGENDNPGKFELFYGEVDDLLAARDYLAGLSYVDPARIYLGGHSTGGTLTLLAVTASDKFRAAFSFGGAPDVKRVVRDGEGYGNTPFDPKSESEGALRSAVNFVDAIRTPTFYFEGQRSSYCDEALAMEMLAQAKRAPFRALIIAGGDHFNILAPLTRLIAERIVADTGRECNVTISRTQANVAFQTSVAARRRRRAAAVAKYPIVELTPAALEKVLDVLKSQSLDPKTNFLQVDGVGKLGFANSFDPATDEKLTQGELTIVVPKTSAGDLCGYLINYVDEGGRKGFDFVDRFQE